LKQISLKVSIQCIAIIKYYDVLCNVVSNEANDMTTITMALETKIKEVKAEDKLPALYSSANREQVVLVNSVIGDKLEGVCMHPKNSFGLYSATWSQSKFFRMGAGSEVTIKFVQQ
jgi:hypothetical protein